LRRQAEVNIKATTSSYAPDVRKFLVDALLFQLASSCISQIGDELHQSSHIGVAAARSAEEATGS
jgi:hypothetical protein